MKIRSKFVSNSSSSNFIVGVDKIENTKFTITIDISEYIDYTIRTIDELNEYFSDRYGCESYEQIKDDEYLLEEYEECKSIISSGKIILCGSASSDGDDPVEQYLYARGLPKDGGFYVIRGID